MAQFSSNKTNSQAEMLKILLALQKGQQEFKNELGQEIRRQEEKSNKCINRLITRLDNWGVETENKRIGNISTVTAPSKANEVKKEVITDSDVISKEVKTEGRNSEGVKGHSVCLKENQLPRQISKFEKSVPNSCKVKKLKRKIVQKGRLQVWRVKENSYRKLKLREGSAVKSLQARVTERRVKCYFQVRENLRVKHYGVFRKCLERKRRILKLRVRKIVRKQIRNNRVKTVRKKKRRKKGRFRTVGKRKIVKYSMRKVVRKKGRKWKNKVRTARKRKKKNSEAERLQCR